jgi:citrate synthase
MTTHVGASEAARLLGVTKPTLYAYVSRGVLSRRVSPDGRRSLYSRDEIDRLRSRSRRRPVERPTIDVAIASAITTLDDRVLRYRGHDAVELAASCSFEAVAELLWSGALPDTRPIWTFDGAELDRCRAAIDAAGIERPIPKLASAAMTLSAHRADDSPADAARRLLALAPSLLGGHPGGTIAERLAGAWQRTPDPALVAVIERTLVLLADHELATSTLSVRIACSVRVDPYSALATGLQVVDSPFHGSSSDAVTRLLFAADEHGAEHAVLRLLDAGERVPGFGHTVYRDGDPRLAPLLAAVRSLAGSGRRIDVVDDVLRVAGGRIGALPNVDFGLGALNFVARPRTAVPLFAVARIAGWAAHFIEELVERPVRFRGVAKPIVAAVER